MSVALPVGIPPFPAGLEPDQALPAQPAQWPSAEAAGYYYIDNTHPSATDASNAYGYPDKPRSTLPGSVTFYRIEIVGGGAAYAHTDRTWTGSGSESTKAAIVGVGSPVIQSSDTGTSRRILLVGQWIIIDGVILDNVHWSSLTVECNNVIYRNLTVRNHIGTSSVRPAISPGYRGTASSIYNENTVIWNTEVYGWGDMESPTEQDNLGCAAGDGVRNLWVIDNHWYDIAGDSIRTGTNVGGGHAPNRAENIYIGRNHFHDNYENAVDVKNSVNTIISQNDMHGFVPSVSSSAECIVVHEYAERVAIFGNTLHDAGVGVSLTSGGQSDIWIVANEFYNIAGSGPADTIATQGNAINWRTLTGDSVTVGNTFFDNDRDIDIEASSTTANYVIANNLFGGTKSTGAHLCFRNGSASLNSANASIRNNLFASGTSSAVLQVSSTQYDTLSAATAAYPGKLVDCIAGAAAVVDAAGRDYTLTASSAAIGAGLADPAVYSTLATLFSTTWTYDSKGIEIPQNGSWDIGANEYSSGDQGAGKRVCGFMMTPVA